MSLSKMTKKESDLWRMLAGKIFPSGIASPGYDLQYAGLCAALRWNIYDSIEGQHLYQTMLNRFEESYGHLVNGAFGMYYWSFKPYGYRQRKKVCLKFANEYKTRKKD